MTGLSAVLDANVTIGLAKGGVFPLLQSLCAPVYVPSAVVEEVVVQGQGRPGAAELQAALGLWVKKITPDPSTLSPLASLTGLSHGDQEVLAVALEKGAALVLTGDHSLTREATQRGFTCLRASSVVVLMKDQGLINEVRPVLDRMRKAGFGISAAVYQAALGAASE